MKKLLIIVSVLTGLIFFPVNAEIELEQEPYSTIKRFHKSNQIEIIPDNYRIEMVLIRISDGQEFEILNDTCSYSGEGSTMTVNGSFHGDIK